MKRTFGIHTQQALLAMVRAGLWEQETDLMAYGTFNFKEICRLAQEQSVIGLVTAGLEHLTDVKFPQKLALQAVGTTLRIEQRNNEMNRFIETAVKKLKADGIDALLLKGQGVAQCYERPMWRPSGDIDFLLDEENYKKAISLMLPLANSSKAGVNQEYAIYTDKWVIELHGSMRTGLSARLDKEIDAVQADIFASKRHRVWRNGETDVLLPAPDDDVFLVFTHFIKHFYKEGMNLRQVCDWCRLLWTYRSEIDAALLEKRLRRAGLMSEWKTFAALAVDYLDMPSEAMPLYHEASRWHRKATNTLDLIVAGRYNTALRNAYTIAKIFPKNIMRILPKIFI